MVHVLQRTMLLQHTSIHSTTCKWIQFYLDLELRDIVCAQTYIQSPHHPPHTLPNTHPSSPSHPNPHAAAWYSFSHSFFLKKLLSLFSCWSIVKRFFEISIWDYCMKKDAAWRWKSGRFDCFWLHLFLFVCLSFFLVNQTLLFTHSSRRYLLKCDVLFVIVVEIAWFFFFWFLFLFFCLECVLRGAALRRPVAGLYGQLKLISMYNRHLIAMLRFSIFYFACFDDLCFCFVAVLFLSVLRGAALRRRPAAWVVFLLFRLVAHATQRDVFYFGRLCWAICWRAHSPKKKSKMKILKNVVRDFCKMRPNWAWQHRRFCVVNSTLLHTRVGVLFDFAEKFHCWPFFRVALSADASEMHLRLVRPAKIFVGLVSYTTVLSTINWIDREILKKFVGANFENVSGL